jgi:hypothetical protein
METANLCRPRARQDVAPQAPADSLPWRCSRCGTEGATTKGRTAQETLLRMQQQHDRVSPHCEPRLVVVPRDGYTFIVDYEFTGVSPGS